MQTYEVQSYPSAANVWQTTPRQCPEIRPCTAPEKIVFSGSPGAFADIQREPDFTGAYGTHEGQVQSRGHTKLGQGKCRHRCGHSGWGLVVRAGAGEVTH